MFNKLKQYKDLRDKAKSLQSVLAAETFEGTGAWGKVKITVDGNQKVQKVEIDPGLLSPSEKTRLEDGVKDALADATKKAQKTIVEKMRESGDFKIPGLTD
ncbi:YbaB/EbfC family nucleoid-associated protein [Candidatus Uhrbacteria bacterium]|nr:YbaB/EbfC family nucleoid-associated protein [Candidatus Uhrbacteria bacterium]